MKLINQIYLLVIIAIAVKIVKLQSINSTVQQALTNTTAATTTLVSTTANSSSSNSSPSVSTITTTTTTTTSTTTASSSPSSNNCTKNSTICNSNGDCELNASTGIPACKCYQNYEGGKCEFKACDEIENVQCLNGGKCLKNILTMQTKCMCTSSYTGALCETPLCIGYCYNDGRCEQVTSAVDNITESLSCQCVNERFYGSKCEFDLCYKNKTSCAANCFLSYQNGKCDCACESRCNELYCNNKGTCETNSQNNLICKCQTGYSGSNCKIDECHAYCFNGGTCLKNNTDKIKCLCTKEFTGERCSDKYVAPKIEQTSSLRIITYIFGASILICTVALLAYAYKRGAFRTVEDKMANCFTRFRSNYQQAPQTSNIPYLRTNNKSTDDLTADPFS